MYFVEINRETIRLNPKYEKWLRELGEGEKDKDKLREELEEVLPKRMALEDEEIEWIDELRMSEVEEEQAGMLPEPEELPEEEEGLLEEGDVEEEEQ